MVLKKKKEEAKALAPDIVVCPKGHPVPKDHGQECKVCGSMLISVPAPVEE